MNKLDPEQGTVFVDLVGSSGKHGDIVIIPQPHRGTRHLVGRGVDHDLFGTHHTPSAFGALAAQFGVSIGPVRAHTGAMRHLIESVFGGYGADLDRLEENVVSGITGHAVPQLIDEPITYLVWHRASMAQNH
jgi:hypothetical protein